MLLAKEQRLAAAALFGVALLVWLIVAVWPSRQEPLSLSAEPQEHKVLSWERRKDSIRNADSVRYAQWAEERAHRYDSFRLADAARRAEWKQFRQHFYDSLRLADSLWRDSMGLRFARHEKRDTILDLNHCDTTELQLLRGIGHYTAVQIVRYREQLGGFHSPTQLTDAPFAGLHLDTLLVHFTADSTVIQPMDVNSCSVERLQRHPYLRFAQAKAIYTLRRRYIRLRSIDDLRSLPEFTDDDLHRLTPYLAFL